MGPKNIRELRAGFSAVALLTGLALSGDARSDSPPRQVTPNPDAGGFAAVYGNIPPDQVEFLSTAKAIRSAALSAQPTAVWEVLEHGEKIECLDCIPVVEGLLFDSNARTREIAAWWLRRRILGVFGPGETYSRVIATVATDADPLRRAYAANALGEFLASPGVPVVALALKDVDPGVRAAAATALGRLNTDASGALTQALGDGDAGVKLAALGSATTIAAFSGVAQVAALTKDPDVRVRRRAVEVLDALGAQDAIAAVLAAAQADTDAGVRAISCHALGSLGARSQGAGVPATVSAVLVQLGAKDPNGFVRDQAQIALLRL